MTPEQAAAMTRFTNAQAAALEAKTLRRSGVDMADVRRKAENAEFFAKNKERDAEHRQTHPWNYEPARWGFSPAEVADRVAAREAKQVMEGAIRKGEAVKTPFGVVGPVAPQVAGEVRGKLVKTETGGYRQMLNPLQQTAQKFPILAKDGPENKAFVAMFNAEKAALGHAPNPLDVAERWNAAEIAKKKAGTATAAPESSITPAKNKQFKDFHGTKFEPTSVVDRRKLAALPALPAVKAAPPKFRTGVERLSDPAAAPAAPAATATPLHLANIGPDGQLPVPVAAAAPAREYPTPEQRHIERLQSNPDMADDFDRMFGAGSAGHFLNLGKWR